MTLQLRFWGTRGSVPSPGPHTVRYGGNTPCVEVRSPAGGVLVLDAGTGIRALGRALDAGVGAPLAADIFLTHLHWDHVQGLPFFAPLYRPENRVRVWGPDTAEAPLARVIRALIAPPTFPVPIDEAGAAIEFATPPTTPVTISGCEVASVPVRHPGGAVGYRLRAPGSPNGGLVYVSDNELRDVPGTEPADAWRAAFLRFASGARVLVHDTTYTAEEYRRRNGWGHSTYGDAVELAHEVGVERLVLYHHNPDRTDDELDRRLEECRALAARRGAALDVVAAAEGMLLDV